jgi:hypothetical protein|tara:strand:+ start:1339 stop:1509 length:171 start_codon:yes stop_codon:yes gene_type:complete
MRHLLALALIVAGLGAAGKADIQEAQRHASQYCLFVAQGTWPDYDDEINCESSSIK